MKIHEEKGKEKYSTPKCSYCREEGHNQYTCPHVAEDWKSLSKYRLPLNKDGAPIRRGWFGVHSVNKDPLKAYLPNNVLHAWFTACQKAMNGQIERKKKAKSGVKKKKAARVCGYCGSTKHTRRTCPEMKQFLKDCYKANENWRRAAYKELVEHHGLSVGACVKVQMKKGWYDDGEIGMGIITDINWNTLNLFSSCAKRSSFAYSPLEITVMVNGEKKKIGNCESFFNIIGFNGHYNGYYFATCSLIDIITPAPEKLPESWITDYKESFETLVKKKSIEILKTGMTSEYSAPNLWAHVYNWKGN